jgi:hypothetical protein
MKFHTSAASGLKSLPALGGPASLIGKETDERRTLNVQHRTSNECILSILKKISRSDSILRHSSFDTCPQEEDSIFCGSLFNPGHRSGQSDRKRNHAILA